MKRALLVLVMLWGCDQNWAQVGDDEPAPGAPDCLSDPELLGELCDVEPDVRLEDAEPLWTAVKHGAQGGETLHTATGVRSWWEYDYYCTVSYCPGFMWSQAWPPREYGSAFYVANNTNRWWHIRQIYVRYQWGGMKTWDLYPDDTLGLCDGQFSWCIALGNLGRGQGISRSGWVDVSDKNMWVPPYSYSPAWQLWVRVQPGVLDTGGMPKEGVQLDGDRVRYVDGP